SAPDSPARNAAPAIDPADVPTITSASRASHSAASASAASAPAWYAPPTTPPAPKTRPTEATTPCSRPGCCSRKSVVIGNHLCVDPVENLDRTSQSEDDDGHASGQSR